MAKLEHADVDNPDNSIKVVISGPRQRGKTTLARRLQKALADLGVKVEYRSTLGLSVKERVEGIYPLDKVAETFDAARCGRVTIVDVE